MISPVNNATPVQNAAQPKASAPPAPAAKPQAPVTDTVQLSSAKALVQEAIETHSQTAHEASTGDVQAARLLARENAAQAALK